MRRMSLACITSIRIKSKARIKNRTIKGAGNFHKALNSRPVLTILFVKEQKKSHTVRGTAVCVNRRDETGERD